MNQLIAFRDQALYVRYSVPTISNAILLIRLFNFLKITFLFNKDWQSFYFYLFAIYKLS